MKNKENQLNSIETQLEMALENCACLGRDAYGDYIKKLKKGLMDQIRNLVN